jgi:hypothetical protein
MLPDETIRRFSREVAEGSQYAWARDAALLAGGVPVYADMRGVLVVFGHGRVMPVSDSNAIRIVEDKRRHTIAYVSAARRFPELRPPP